MSYNKVGGLHFIRCGQLVMSFCISRKHKPASPVFYDVAGIGFAIGAIMGCFL